MVKVEKGTTLQEFWALLPEGTEDALLELEPDGQAGAQETTVEGVGRVSYWVDACSEGVDRGGYVAYVKLHEVEGPEGKPVILEEDAGPVEFLFESRMVKLL